tara:strand:- start:92 stop:535 length:444 start_codon:yes stop_codon:yes gene_type:complete
MNHREILLVEDNPDDVALTVRAFKKNNITNHIVNVSDGVEALDYIFARGNFADRNPEELPTVVLLDLKLPKMDGHEVLKSIRANELTKYVPVIILTSSKEEEDLIKGYKNGCNSYVQKPVDFNQFVEAVQNLGLYWLILNEPPPKKQ